MDMVDGEVVVLKLGVPSGCAIIEFARVFPEGEIGVISEDNELLTAPSEVGSLVFKGFQYGVEFFFVDVVVVMCGCECGGIESDWV